MLRGGIGELISPIANGWWGCRFDFLMTVISGISMIFSSVSGIFLIFLTIMILIIVFDWFRTFKKQKYI